MKIEIELESINYEEIIEICLPHLKEFSDEPVMQTVSHIPPNLVKPIIRTLPQSTLDKLAENIVNKKKDVIIQNLEDMSAQKGIHIKINDINLKNQ